jgi:hypothetical protein
MSSIGLKIPLLDDGIRSVRFFNGRLLAAEDLSREQDANRAAHQRIGRAAGEGIVTGLQVERSLDASAPLMPVVTVKAGLAVNRAGQVLTLASDVDVALTSPPAGSAATIAQIFADCQPIQRGPYVAEGGMYLLAISPVEVSQGRAPFSGLGNAPAACNTDHTVEGVQFRLIQLSLTPEELADTRRLRNLVAYKCFGVQDSRYRAFVGNPFGPPVEQYGLVDDLRGKCLHDTDVPLAVIHWTRAGLDFVDNWSVRRRLARHSVSQDWPLFVDDRRASEAEAMFLQFQSQVTALRLSEPNPESLIASQYLRFLPPVGLLPLTGGGSLRGFVQSKFFGGLTTRGPVFIEGAGLEALVRRALPCAPIDTQSGELIWLYVVRENRDPRAAGGSGTPYLVFTSGHVPFAGATRLDVARTSGANYTLVTALTGEAG